MSDANDLRQPDDREFVPSVATGETRPITPEDLARLDALEKGHGYFQFSGALVSAYPAIRALIAQQAGRIAELEKELKRYVEFAKDVRDETPKGFPEGFEG